MLRSLRLFSNKAHPIPSYKYLKDLGKLDEAQTKLGKRHTLMHPPIASKVESTKRQKLRLSAFNEFKTALLELKGWEKTGEKEILDEYSKNLADPEKEELFHAWKIRKNYEEFHKRDLNDYREIKEPEVTEFVLMPTEKFIMNSISKITESDIGKFIQIPRETLIKEFPNGLCGDIMSDQYSRTQTIGVMLYEEAYNIISWTQDSSLYSQIADEFLQKLYAKQSVKLETMIRNSPEIHEFLIDFICNQFKSSQEGLSEYISSLLSSLEKHIPEADCLRSISITMFLDYLSKDFSIPFSKNPIKPREEKLSSSHNILLHGSRGSGKSQVLNMLNYWAMNQPDWICIKVPRGSDFTRNATPIIWHPSGLYLQPEVACDLLSDIVDTNAGKLEKIPVDLSIYGKYNLAGLHDVYDEHYKPLPSQHTYIRDLEAYTDDWKQFYPQEVLTEIFKGIKELKLKPRHKRIEYELNLLENVQIPQVIVQRIKDSNYYDNIDPDSILKPHKSKRKPKKFMLPKVSDDELSFRHKLPAIHTQDLMISENDDDVEQGDIATRLSEHLPQPQNLQEIADFALRNEIYATNAIFEILLQLYRNETMNVLVSVDEFNEFFKKTVYYSLKYANYKKTRDLIPPYDIALCRAFMRMDGHMIKRGLKIVGTSEKHFGLHKTNWKKGMGIVPDKFCIEMNGVKLDDFRNAVHYYSMTSWLNGNLKEEAIEHIYMQTQGNLYHANTRFVCYSPFTY